MDRGTFSISGCADDALGPTCDLDCEETCPDSVHTGIGAIRGQLWRPFLRCSRAGGLAVQLHSLEVSGGAQGIVVREALAAGQGDPKSLERLRDLLPGHGGQPGPEFNDIQCVLRTDAVARRGGLYISGGSAAIEHNLDKIKATAVLRLGVKHPPLPHRFVVKMIELSDTLDADLACHIDACNGFLEENLSEGRSVLVHCGAGVSRSGSAVIAYLMLSRQLHYNEALKLAKQAREWICPNTSFALQLEKFEVQLAERGHFGQSDTVANMSGLGAGMGDVQCVRPPAGPVGGLYISSAFGASFRNMSLLDVQALLRMGGFTCLPDKECLCQLTIALDDSEAANLIAVLDDAVHFVETSRHAGKNTLVHCGAGISRSAAVVAAVLMRCEDLSADAAMHAVKAARQWASPNPGFQRQLREWA